MKPTLRAKQASVGNAPRKALSVPRGRGAAMKHKVTEMAALPSSQLNAALGACTSQQVHWQQRRKALCEAGGETKNWTGDRAGRCPAASEHREPQSGHLQGRVGRHEGAMAMALEQSGTLQWLGCRKERRALGPARNSHASGLQKPGTASDAYSLP